MFFNLIMVSLSVIIPVLNEEKLIVDNTIKLIKYLNKLKIDYEILIVSNGSTDNTIKLGFYLDKKYSNVRFFHLNKKGVGGAFLKAISVSKKEFILSLDMDLSVNLDFIKMSLKYLDQYDIVIGAKKTGKQERAFYRLIPSMIYIFLVRLLLGLKYSDFSMAAKIYRTDIAKKYESFIDNGSSYIIDIIYFAYKDGFKIIEIPVYCKDTRKSKFNLIYESIYRFRRLIKLLFIRIF